MNIEKESPEERELFERIKNQSVAMPDYLHLMEELAVARMLIRELGDRLAKLEKPWVGLTDEDDIDWEEGGNLKDLVKAIEEKLKEKNT
jgi:hypothetical protein